MRSTKLILLTISLTIFASISNAKDLFYIKKGKQFELCKEVNQILNDPINKDYADPYIIPFSEFTIPKKYKNFKLPVWEDVASEDLGKYFRDSKKEWIKNLLNKDKYKTQKTIMDYDHDGKNETIIRFSHLDENGNIFQSKKIDDRNIKVNSISDTDDEIYQAAVKNKNHGLSYTDFSFFYKGRVYNAGGTSTMVIINQPDGSLRKYFALDLICDIRIIPEKEEMAYKHYKFDSDSTFLKELEEIQKLTPTESRKNTIEKVKERIKNNNPNTNK